MKKSDLLDNQQHMEVINDILLSLNNSPSGTIIKSILEKTGDFMGLSRIILFKDDSGHNLGKASYEWSGANAAPVMGSGPYQLYYRKDIPEIADHLKNSELMAIDFGGIPKGCAGEFSKHDVLAACIQRVGSGENRYGFVMFQECDEERKWSRAELEYLGIIAKLLAFALERSSGDEKLEATRKIMKTILDYVPSYIFIEDPATNRIVFSNRAFKRYFTEEAESSSDLSILHDSMIEYCKNCPKKKAGATRCVPHYFEFEQNDFIKWVGVQCNQITWTDGRTVRLFNAKNITERKYHEECIVQAAYIDHLTKLPNRYQCILDLQKGAYGGGVFIDIDDFKTVNCEHGHNYGDALLVALAGYLKSIALPGDKIYRIGDDEFAVLVNPQNVGNIKNYVNTLLDCANTPWKALDKELHITSGMGVVQFPTEGIQLNEIFKSADISIQEAKQSGKNACKYVTLLMPIEGTSLN